MELEKQVVSLELAKQLKELGVKQDSLYWWVNEDADGVWKPKRYHMYGETVYSAFTVVELFDYLYTEKGELWIYHNAGKYLVQGFHSEANEENLADCLAKILIANL